MCGVGHQNPFAALGDATLMEVVISGMQHASAATTIRLRFVIGVTA
jgi:hypothetical protein